MMEIFAAGAWRGITRGEIIAGGTPRRLTRGEMYIGGQWRPIFSFIPTLSVSAPAGIYASQAVNATVNVATDNVTATPIGGAPGYSYSWALISGSGIAISNPTLATTRFSAPMPAASIRNGVARVTVTDSRGTSAFADVAVTLENVDIR